MPDYMANISISKPSICAGVLLGGESRRMGRAKGLLPWRGQPFVEHLCQSLQQQGAAVKLLVGEQRQLYENWQSLCLDDAEPFAGQGPLAGILALLEQADCEWVAVVPGDYPRLPTDWLHHLERQVEQQVGEQPVFCLQSDRLQPLYMLAHRSVALPLRRYLSGGGRRVMEWVQQVGYGEFSAPAGWQPDNLNHWSDYQRWLAVNR